MLDLCEDLVPLIKVEASATILHHDIDYALEGIKKAYSEQKRGKTIMKQSHSLLVGNSDFRSLIVEMTSKLNGSDINQLLIFYGNLEGLEKLRQESLIKSTIENPKDATEKLMEFGSYFNMLDVIREYDNDKRREAFSNVRKISVLKM